MVPLGKLKPATGVTLNPQRPSAGSRRQPREIDFAGQRVHLIGVGGCGMSCVAAMLLRCGAVVSGSDRQRSLASDALTEAGARVFVGQRASNLPPRADLVVVSAAVPEQNEELRAAQAAGFRVLKYAQLLGELMQLRQGVAIAGTHGKSTTTALSAYLFRAAGLDPSFVVGAQAPQLGGGSGVGLGPHFIVEACEFDRSFLHLRPQSAAILNVEADHLDCYRDLEEIREAFRAFARNVHPDGLIVVGHADRALLESDAPHLPRVETFGLEPGATWRAAQLTNGDGRYTFEVLYEERPLFRTSLTIAGKHNVGNALAAIALAWHAGAGREALAEGLKTFHGVDRRMTLRGEPGGIRVVDDYAHHPTEIQVTLAALKDRYHPGRLWVVFQPHQHSRTRLLMEAFAASFAAADRVIIPDIYVSRDSDVEIKRTCALDLVTKIQLQGGDVRYVPALSEAAALLEHEVRPGDLVVTMGAGDVWKLADDLVERLQRTR